MDFKLSDEQWQLIEPLTTRQRRLETRGRPRRPNREIVDAVLWLIQERRSWRGLRYKDFPPFQTVHRRYREWSRAGILIPVLETLARDLEERGGIPLQKCFLDEIWETLKDKNPATTFVISEDGLTDATQLPWQTLTRIYFESPRIWRVLYAYGTPWIQERLPVDLPQRLRYF